MTLIAQITDLHIGFDRGNRDEVNVHRLEAVMDRLLQMTPRPELLLVTGDLVENGDDTSAYEHMHALLGRWPGPMLFAIGNHDNRANFTAQLPAVATDPNGFIQYEADVGRLRLIVIDTLDEGRHGGAFCEDRAAWLRQRLAEKTDQPTLLILHHPPVDTGIDWMSAESGETWVRRLESVVEPASQVLALIAGHVHRPISTLFGGRPLIVCPSTAPAVALDLEPVDPEAPDDRALIIADPPGFALHMSDGRQLLTHFDVGGPRDIVARYDPRLQPMMRAFLDERGTG